MKQNDASFTFPFNEVRAPRGFAREFLAKTLEKVARGWRNDQCVDQVAFELWPVEAFHLQVLCNRRQHMGAVVANEDTVSYILHARYLRMYAGK